MCFSNLCLPSLLFLGFLSFSACKNDKTTATTTEAQTEKKDPDGPESFTQLPTENIPTKEGAIKMNITGCTLNWTGSKFVGDRHQGTIQAKSGELLVKNGYVLGGTITFDMNSIANSDIEDPGMRKKLESHLKAADFFDVAKYPTATFEIKETIASVNVPNINRVIVGDLTIKGQSHPVNIPVKISISDTEVEAQSANFSINRTRWGINFQSSLAGVAQDKLISDDFVVAFTLQANAQ